MLESTFLHINHIGRKKEQSLWESGVSSWSLLDNYMSRQLSLFDESSISLQLKNSMDALEREDIEFFASRLPLQEYYRIALTFPERTLFLDIETTGLSIYYDDITVIGWLMKNQYGVYIKGTDEIPFREALEQAKVIITFNGSLFDIPFIKKKFPDIVMPSIHIDLRFMGKRLGMVGGQKVIEKELGFIRSSIDSEITGEEAPLLWHKYLNGKIDSLRGLINYNYTDVKGMVFIFTEYVKKIFFLQNIPKHIRKERIFEYGYDNDLINKNRIENMYIPYPIKSTFITINSIIPSTKNLRIVGIDLTGSDQRPSGWCILKGSTAVTKRLGSLSEIIEETIHADPVLVSIDSPLSLPQGRLSAFDDDPTREQYGIMRVCERILKKRGINVYPSLIPSMQRLTERGIKLAKHLRSLGLPVIESYPGAAQDIMGIPRKQKGLDLLKNGLSNFGIVGDFLLNDISHDELDAITSAIVGAFFWGGRFEKLGIVEENFLIVPDITTKNPVWNNRIVVGFSGEIASGKTTASRMLESQGFTYGRYSMVLEDLLIQRGIEVNRKSLQDIGKEINQIYGQYWLSTRLLEKLSTEHNLVIDGLRFPEDHAFMQEIFGPSFLHIHIESDINLQHNRYISRDGNSNFISAHSHTVESKIPYLKTLAHVIVNNRGSLEDLSININNIIKSFFMNYEEPANL